MSERHLVALALGAGLGALLGACDAPVFYCDHDRECTDGARNGVCEPDGYCSFADERCPSGRAYGAHAPEGLAGRCTRSYEALASTGGTEESGATEETGADTTSEESGDVVVPERAEGSSGDESSTTETPLVDGCTDGVRNGDESDVDCGGACGPCGPCDACTGDEDCDAGTCEDGACRVRASFTTDWRSQCNNNGTFALSVTVPPGLYQVTALESAGSKWPADAGNNGKTWAWWLDCDEVELLDLRTPVGGWYATADIAFDTLLYPSQPVLLLGGTLSCGVHDDNCTDNRGGVAVELENVCP